MQAVPISGIPCFQRIGAAGVQTLEHAEPSTATMLGTEDSFVAAATPPSELHWSSSTMNLIGCPRILLPASLKAISAPRLESVPSAVSAPEITHMPPTTIGAPFGMVITPKSSFTGPAACAATGAAIAASNALMKANVRDFQLRCDISASSPLLLTG